MPEKLNAHPPAPSCQSTIPSIDQLYAENHQLKADNRALIKQLRAARTNQGERRLVGVA